MIFSKTVKTLYVIKNRQGAIVKLTSGKFCWEKLDSANNAIVLHLKKSVLYASRDTVNEEKIQKIVENGWIVRLHSPTEYRFILEGVTHKVDSIKEVRETFIKTGVLRIEEVS